MSFFPAPRTVLLSGASFLLVAAAVACSSSSTVGSSQDGGHHDVAVSDASKQDAPASDSARHDSSSADAGHEASAEGDSSTREGATGDSGHDGPEPADALEHDSAKDGPHGDAHVGDGATDGDAVADALPDGFVPCTFDGVLTCEINCDCWMGIPASCLPPGSINYYGAVDPVACSTYCPTTTSSEGSFCATGGRLDGGKFVMGVDSGTDAWVYCRSDTCAP
jgi:hypothetical protein